jgi:hypothetical protein
MIILYMHMTSFKVFSANSYVGYKFGRLTIHVLNKLKKDLCAEKQLLPENILNIISPAAESATPEELYIILTNSLEQKRNIKVIPAAILDLEEYMIEATKAQVNGTMTIDKNKYKALYSDIRNSVCY